MTDLDSLIADAAAQLPTITEDTIRFADGWTITRHVIDYPEREPGNEFCDAGRGHTQYVFEVNRPDGKPFDSMTRIVLKDATAGTP